MDKFIDSIKTRFIVFYGQCWLVTRDFVLANLEFQYEGTEDGYDGLRYDIYSNDDGDYFAVREDEQ